MFNLATGHRTRLAVVGAEHKPSLIVEVAQVERPGIVARIHTHRHGRKTPDGTRAFRTRLVAQVGSGRRKPVQIVDQAALIDFPALLGAAIGIQQVIGMHKVRAHVVHVELGHRGQTHISVIDHAARNDARLLHDAIARHAKFLHVRQVGSVLKVRTGNGLNARHVLADNLAGAGRKDIRRRHVDRAVCIGQDVVLEGNKLVERCNERLFVLPCLVVVQRAIVGIPERQRLMVVAMKAQFTAHLQQHAAKIAELRGIGLARGLGLVDHVLVVLDHHAGIANAILLREFLQVGPPHLGIKVGDGKAVVAFDVRAVARGNGAREIVQVKHGAIDDRIGRGIAQQAHGRGIETTHDLIVDTDIAHHGTAAAAIARPNKRSTRVAGFSPHVGCLTQRNRERRIEGVRELITLAAADHKVLARHDALCHRIFIAGRIDAQLGTNCLQIARIVRRHGEHQRTAGAHPAHDVGEVRTEPIERRHQ